MKLAAASLALVLAGCKPDAPPPVPYVPPAPAVYAPECSSTADPRWLDLPDRDASRSEAARNYRENKARFRVLERLRAACRASHRTHEGRAE